MMLSSNLQQPRPPCIAEYNRSVPSAMQTRRRVEQSAECRLRRLSARTIYQTWRPQASYRLAMLAEAYLWGDAVQKFAVLATVL